MSTCAVFTQSHPYSPPLIHSHTNVTDVDLSEITWGKLKYCCSMVIVINNLNFLDSDHMITVGVWLGLEYWNQSPVPKNVSNVVEQPHINRWLIYCWANKQKFTPKMLLMNVTVFRSIQRPQFVCVRRGDGGCSLVHQTLILLVVSSYFSQLFFL